MPISVSEAKYLEKLKSQSNVLRNSLAFNEAMYAHYKDRYENRDRLNWSATVTLWFKMRSYEKALWEARLEELLTRVNFNQPIIVVTKRRA